MKRYEISSYSTESGTYEIVARKGSVKDAINYCRDIIKYHYHKRIEHVRGINYTYIYGEDENHVFQAFWIRMN